MSLLIAADHAGVFVFALSGALMAVRHRLDIVGIVVLAMATSLAGGVMRDVALGLTPPIALRNPSYPLCAVAAALLTFFAHPILFRVSKPVALLDALGLGVFTVVGCQKAIEQETNAVTALLIATLTAVGGGIVRDLLVSEVPLVLREEVYALAALAGAAVMLVGAAASAPALITAGAGFATAVTLRLGGMRWGWSAPRVPWADSVPPR